MDAEHAVQVPNRSSRLLSCHTGRLNGILALLGETVKEARTLVFARGLFRFMPSVCAEGMANRPNAQKWSPWGMCQGSGPRVEVLR